MTGLLRVGQSARRPFEGIAAFYSQCRPSWPDQVFSTIAQRFRLDGTGRMLDLGCGPGNLTIPLARYVAEAFGVDPEPDMLAEAKIRAARLGIRNVTWIQAKAENLADFDPRDRLGQSRLVTMGASLHWMDRQRVLETAYRLLASGGGLVIVEEDVGKTWVRGVVDETLKEFLGDLPQHPARPPQEGRHEDVVSRSRFAGLEKLTLDHRRFWGVEQVIGWVYSFSHGAYFRLDVRRPAFERALRERLFAIDGSGIFTEDVRVDLIFAWKS